MVSAFTSVTTDEKIDSNIRLRPSSLGYGTLPMMEGIFSHAPRNYRYLTHVRACVCACAFSLYLRSFDAVNDAQQLSTIAGMADLVMSARIYGQLKS